MSERKSKQRPDNWEDDKNFADFLREYVENDAYLQEENEHLRTYITYRALYGIYTHSIDIQSKIELIAEKHSQCYNVLEKANCNLNKVIDEQEKINEMAKFYTKLVIVGSISLLIVMGYFIYKLFIVETFILF